MKTELKVAITHSGEPLFLHSSMVNRHGMIAGATGTGKTVTLKVFAEQLSSIGVPSLVIDVKGDLNSFGQSGSFSEKFQAHLDKIGVKDAQFDTFPIQFWDLFGEKGLPVRATVTDMGPMLISRLLSLNDTQTAILHTIFKIADDEGWLLLDFKDLTEIVKYFNDEGSAYKSEYGNLSKQSLSAILRSLTALDEQNVDLFFGEKDLDIKDMMSLQDGKGMINVLDATKLMFNPKLYSTFLIWLMAELFENFEEAGDLDQPKMVFFFDEAHLIFDDISDVLLDKLEQTIKLIRSKGIGIYFITQNPLDVPDSVLGQLGNRVQHALRAYTPKELQVINKTAQTFRINPDLDLEKELMELGVGEAAVSFLDEKGVPSITQKAFIMPPKSLIGIAEGVDPYPNSSLYNKYKEPIDRESAYELLARKADLIRTQQEAELKALLEEKQRKDLEKEMKRNKPARSGSSLAGKMASSMVTSIGRSIGTQLMRGLLGTLKKL